MNQNRRQPNERAAGKEPTRRDALRVLSGAALLPVVACTNDAASSVLPDVVATDAGDSGQVADNGADAVRDATMDTATDLPDDATPAPAWATGGTASMRQKETYPDPFLAGLGSCLLVVPMTGGPCTTEAPPVREDVSEGWTGLPMRLVLKVVDQACAPIAGVRLRIWHTNVEGSYSGQTPSNRFCLKDQDYASLNFFRGEGETDPNGVVAFDSCFPGAYPGRAIHIHFQALRGETTYRVSQLFFPEEVTNDVYATQPEYAAYGPPDTNLATDGISSRVSAAELDGLTLRVERMPDGAMLAYKAVAVA